MLSFKGVRRQLMQPGRWTELFFLDEATALAAGHRPCAYCQRARYDEYRAAWAQVNPVAPPGQRPSANEMDAVLHAERLDTNRQRRTYPARLDGLPDGVFVVHADEAHLVRAGALWPWTPAGYGSTVTLPPISTVAVLTPRSTVRVLAAGFEVQMAKSPS